MTKILPLLNWRRAICDSELGPTTKHVALTLSLWMNEMGGSAFPGAELLAKNTSLSVRAVRTHLKLLVRERWLLLVEEGGIKGETKRANAYQAAIPTPAPRSPIEQAPLHLTTLTPASDDTDPCTTFTPSLQELSSNSSRGTTAENGGPDSRIQKIVAGYVDDYRAIHGGHEPSVRWRGAAGKAVKTALADGESPEDIATCLDISAREGKIPSALPHILSDMHANRPRRARR